MQTIAKEPAAPVFLLYQLLPARRRQVARQVERVTEDLAARHDRHLDVALLQLPTVKFPRGEQDFPAQGRAQPMREDQRRACTRRTAVRSEEHPSGLQSLLRN